MRLERSVSESTRRRSASRGVLWMLVVGALLLPAARGSVDEITPGEAFLEWSTGIDALMPGVSPAANVMPLATNTEFAPDAATTYGVWSDRVFAVRNVADAGGAAGSARGYWRAPGFLSTAPVVVPAPGMPLGVVFVGTGSGFLSKLDGDMVGPFAAAELGRVDVRRPGPLCLGVPGDMLRAAPVVQRYALSNDVFQAWATARGHQDDDLVLVGTANGCLDRTHNRILAYWASDLSLAWIFNADGFVKVDAVSGVAVDYETNLVSFSTDLADGAVSQNSLFALDARTGTLVWATNAGAVLGRPLLGTGSRADRVYVARKDGEVRAYDDLGNGLGGGLLLWAAPTANAVVIPPGDPVLIPDGVAVLDGFGSLHAIVDEGATWSPAWSVDWVNGMTWVGNPTLSEVPFPQLFVGTSDGGVAQIDPATGEVQRVPAVSLSPFGEGVVLPTLDVDPLTGDPHLMVMVRDPSSSPPGLVARMRIPFYVPPPPRPIANPDDYKMVQDTALVVDAPGVLANDVEPRGLPLTAQVVAAPLNGMLVFAADGSFVYQPAAGFHGTDTFDYMAGNGVAFSPRARATIVVAEVVAPPEVSFTAVQASVAEDDPAGARFAAMRTGDTSAELRVFYTIAGTATSGVDYDALGGILVFPPSSAFAFLTVQPIDDALVEPTEDVMITLRPAAAYVLGAVVDGSTDILDDDVLPEVSFTAVQASVGEDDPAGARFAAMRTGDTSAELRVLYTVAGTATEGVDYDALGGILVFPPGAAFAFLTVQPIDDKLVEPTEDVMITMVPAPAYVLGAVVDGSTDILDDDVAPVLPEVSFTAVQASVSESSSAGARFTAVRTGDASQELRVLYTVAGAATSGVDYEALNGILVFPPGAATAVLRVRPIDDKLVEPNENVAITMRPAPAYTLGAIAAGSTDILDDDAPVLPAPGVIGFDANGYSVQERAGLLVVTVERKDGTLGGVRVSFATVESSAREGADYVGVQGVLEFGPNETSRTFTVPIVADQLAEKQETLTVVLSNPTSGAVLGKNATATIRIRD